MQVFTVRDKPASNRIDYWNQLCSDIYSPTFIDPIDREGFFGTMEVFDAHQFKITRYSSAPVIMRRTRSHASRASGTSTTMFLRLEGQTQFAVRGKLEVMKPGDIMLLDAYTPFEFETKERVAALTVSLPDNLVLAHLPLASRVLGKCLSGESELNAMAAAILRLVYGQATRGVSPSPKLLRALLELISANIESPKNDGSVGTPTSERWRRRAKSFILANLRDPDLRPSHVANGLGISGRYLRKLFDEEDQSISKLILGMRLDESARCLLSSDWSDIPITEIAFHWGFSDSGYFARCFKDRFGVPPSIYRTHA